MKKIYVLFTIILGVCFISCGSAPKAEEVTPEAPVVEETVSEVVEEPEEVEEIPEEDEVELIEEEVSIVDEDDEEYIRSTKDLSEEELVTKDEFAEDKAEILRIIKELQKVMEKEDVEAWLKYVDKDSKTFYSNPANIRKETTTVITRRICRLLQTDLDKTIIIKTISVIVYEYSHQSIPNGR